MTHSTCKLTTSQRVKIEYGDFQTPLELAERICQTLIDLDIAPEIVIEPSCGVGNFIEAASCHIRSARKILGVDINPLYVRASQQKFSHDPRIEIHQGDFFNVDWQSLVDRQEGRILVLGNFPWVTNSQQGSIGGDNLPRKCNFQNHSGLDSITGKSNFDVSEWMLIQVVQWLQGRDSSLAMLCKSIVARKLLGYLHDHSLNLAYCAIYYINAKTYFSAAVDACLLVCKFDATTKHYICNVFKGLSASDYHQIGYQHNVLIRDPISFVPPNNCHDKISSPKWRSGIKHDCSKVMEFRRIGDTLVNGFGNAVDLEETYLFPLLKGSDIANDRTQTTNRYVLVTQRFIGESTNAIRELAPNTWQYLESHAHYLDNRKSKIYRNHSRFSIFGVGAYTFSPWKIAICGLYKTLTFRLIGTIDNKSTMVDDTVYFLSFDDEETASKTLQLLNMSSTIDFYSSLIFWDEKRPIKSSILNRLDLTALAAPSEPIDPRVNQS